MRVLQLILALSFLVMIHELGHFCFARLFKVRVEKFYMFFNPWFSLVRMKRFNGKWHFRFLSPNTPDTLVPLLDKETGEQVLDKKGNPQMRPMTEEELKALPEDDWRRYPETTEWGIGWLPLGGYCNIAGMIDETTSAGELLSEPQPWEYRSKKTWQRLPIIIGGVLVNFIAALVIYSAVFYHWGQEYLPVQNAVYGFDFAEPLQEQGLQNGDKILFIGDRMPETTKDVVEWILVDGVREVVVLRDKNTVRIDLAADLDQTILASGSAALVDFRFPFVVDSVMPSTAAAAILLAKGDSVIAVNGTPAVTYQEVVRELQKYACDSVTLDFVRNGEVLSARTFIGDEAKLGVFVKPIDQFITVERKEYGFFESIPAGINYGWETLTSYVKQFKIVFTKEGAKQMGGFIAIGKIFPKVWDWHAFWLMTAFLSIILAFMNIIPIPGLDGGYVLFLLWEMLTGRKPSDKFLTIVNNIGFFLLMLLLLYANGMDIWRLFK